MIGTTSKVVTLAESSKGLVEIETHQIAKIYSKSDEDQCTWRTEGTPSLDIVCKKPDTVAITCASAVNRIKAVIAARPGYVPVTELGPLA